MLEIRSRYLNSLILPVSLFLASGYVAPQPIAENVDQNHTSDTLTNIEYEVKETDLDRVDTLLINPLYLAYLVVIQ